MTLAVNDGEMNNPSFSFLVVFLPFVLDFNFGEIIGILPLFLGGGCGGTSSGGGGNGGIFGINGGSPGLYGGSTGHFGIFGINGGVFLLGVLEV